MIETALLKADGGINIFDAGIASAFGLLHLLLFLFYPRKRANLFFSLFAISVAVRALSTDVFDPAHFSGAMAATLGFASIVSVAFAVFSFIQYLYTAFGERTPVYFWIAAIAWMLAALAPKIYPPLARFNPAGLLVIVFVAVESLRVIGRALARHLDGAWIVGVGVLLLVITPLKDGLEILTDFDMPDFWDELTTQISVCGIIVANSVFLARNFARTNLELEEQLVQVKELSARELEHERIAADLRLQNEQERARLALVEQELALAAGIQQALFPEDIPQIAGYDIAAFNRPARVCGGDYYDVLAIENTDGGASKNGSYLFCVADVSGKGLPAALLMSNMQATLRALAGRATSLTELAARTNELLYATSPSNKFVTAILVEINPATGVGGYVNAGHNECLLLRRDGGETELLKTTGLPLGMFAGMLYEEKSFQLNAGDLLALFSDGVTEAQSKTEEEWGEANLQEHLHDAKDNSAQGIVGQVIREIDRFADGVPQHDDITLLVLKPMNNVNSR